MFGLRNLFSSVVNQAWNKLELRNKINTINMAVNYGTNPEINNF